MSHGKILDEFGRSIPVDSKPKTAGYNPGPRAQFFTRMRELPLFTFRQIYEMLNDPVIRLGLAMRAAPLSSAEFAYKENGEWIEGVQSDKPEVGQFVHRQMERLWRNDLHKFLTSQIWGWAAGEVVFRIRDNHIEYDKIFSRNAEDVGALVTEGELTGVRFMRIKLATGGRVDLNFPQCFWHSFNPESDRLYGRSILNGSYSSWADKWLDHGALDVRRLFMVKDAYAGARVGYPPGSTDIDGKGDIPNRDIAREMNEQSMSGAVMNFPVVFDENGHPLWVVEDAKVTDNPQHIFTYVKDLDTEMLRGMEIPDDVLTSEATGSWAGKVVPQMAFYKGLELWLTQIVAVCQSQIMEQLVLFRFGRAEEFQIRTKPLAEQIAEQEQRGQPQGQQQVASPSVDESLLGSDTDETVANILGVSPGKVAEERRARGISARSASRMSLSSTADTLVGQAILSASDVVLGVKAAMRRNLTELAPPQSNGNGPELSELKESVQRLSTQVAQQPAPTIDARTDVTISPGAIEAQILTPPGPSGERGDRGDTGDRGDDGAPGQRGERGSVGQQGDHGSTGGKGERGTTGGRGAKGEKGDTPDITIEEGDTTIVVHQDGENTNES